MYRLVITCYATRATSGVMCMRIFKGINRLKRIFDTTIDTVVTLILVILIVVVFIQVFSRYVLNDPKTWTEELARYLFVWLVFTGSTVVFRENRHLSIDYFVSFLPTKIRRIVSVAINIIIAAFIVVALYHSNRLLAITSYQTSPTLVVPMSWIYLSFPLSLGLMLIELIFRLALWFTNRINGSTGLKEGDVG